MRRRETVKTIILAVTAIAACVLPLLTPGALLHLFAGVLLVFGSFRIGCALYPAVERRWPAKVRPTRRGKAA
jgi:hypothetical protein